MFPEHDKMKRQNNNAFYDTYVSDICCLRHSIFLLPDLLEGSDIVMCVKTLEIWSRSAVDYEAGYLQEKLQAIVHSISYMAAQEKREVDSRVAV